MKEMLALASLYINMIMIIRAKGWLFMEEIMLKEEGVWRNSAACRLKFNWEKSL